MITENENTKEGIAKIMDHINAFVPNSDSDEPIKIISGGDQLTCERQENIQVGEKSINKTDFEV